MVSKISAPNKIIFRFSAIIDFMKRIYAQFS